MLSLKIVQIIFVLISSIIVISESTKGVYGCFKKFNNEKELTKTIMDCMTTLNINSSESGPNYEDYVKADFDDKCLGKCVLAGMELIMANGNLDKDAFFDMIEDNGPKALVNKLTEAVTKCASSSGIEKIDKKDDCKPYGNFKGCFLMATDKLC